MPELFGWVSWQVQPVLAGHNWPYCLIDSSFNKKLAGELTGSPWHAGLTHLLAEP